MLKYFFSLFFCDLFYLGLGFIPNISLELKIFFYLLHFFVKFSGRDISVFRVMAVARERSRLVRPKAKPTGDPTPLANAAIDILPVIAIEVI